MTYDKVARKKHFDKIQKKAQKKVREKEREVVFFVLREWLRIDANELINGNDADRLAMIEKACLFENGILRFSLNVLFDAVKQIDPWLTRVALAEILAGRGAVTTRPYINGVRRRIYSIDFNKRREDR